MRESVEQLTRADAASVVSLERERIARLSARSGAGVRGIVGAHRRHALIILSALAPFLSFVLVSRGDWLLDYRWQDNWSYLKYFHDWTSTDPVLRDFLDHDYKGSRVAWILLGYLVYHALEPLAANLALNFAVAALTILLTLAIAARLFGSVAGAATIVASAFPVFYASGFPHAWSYQGGICNLFYLMLLGSLTEHANGRARRRWALVAGSAATLTFLTGTTYIVAFPWAFAYWLLLRGRPTVAELLQLGAIGIAGAVIAGAVLATANVLAGGSALFMLPLFQRSVGLASGPSFGGRLVEWLPAAYWLAFPAIVLIGGVATSLVLAHRRMLHRPEARTFVAAFVGFAGLWGTMIALEATVQAYVQYAHYNFMITGPAALALAGILRWLPRGARAGDLRWPGLVYPVVALAVVLPQLLLDPSHAAGITDPVTQGLRAWSLPGTGVAGVVAGVVGLGFVAVGAWRPLLPAGVCFGLACALTNPAPSPFHMSAACGIERENYLLVSDITRWMADNEWHVTTRAWFPQQDPLARSDGCDPVDLHATYLAIEQAGMLWQISMPLPARIADLRMPEVRNIAEKRRSNLVILSQPQLAQQYDRELDAWTKASGMHPSPRRLRARTFTRGSLSVTVQVYRLMRSQDS